MCMRIFKNSPPPTGGRVREGAATGDISPDSPPPRPSPRPGEGVVLFLCIALQAALTFCYAITLHYQLKTSGFDSMVYEQLMQNFLDGKGFTSSINPPYAPQYWLGFHFSPILYLIIPFYYFFPHVETFLVIGSISVALAAWPIFLVARTLLKDSSQALLMALLYLTSPFVVNGTIWGFHEIDFAPLCLSWMLWAVVHKKRGVLLALSIVLLCIKEHYGLSVAGFGVLWAWQWREMKFGLSVAAGGIAALCTICFVIIPHFNPAGVATMMNAASGEDRFSWITGMDGIQSHFASIASDGFWYGLKLLLPFLLLPLGAFMWLLPAMADVAANSLSLQMMMRLPFSYHSIAVMPVLVIALCQAFKYFPAKKKSNDIMLAVVVASTCFSYMQLALPFSEMGNVWELSAPQFDYSPADRKAIDDINALIGPDASVSAQVNILPHLKPRFDMSPYPLATGNADTIIVQLAFPFKRALSVMGIPYSVSGSTYFSNVESLLHNPNWSVVYYSNRWLVLQKNAADNPANRTAALQGLASLTQEYEQVKEAIRHPRHD